MREWKIFVLAAGIFFFDGAATATSIHIFQPDYNITIQGTNT